MAWPASLSPKVVGSAWMPCVRPTQSVSGVAQRQLAQGRRERRLLAQQQLAGAADRQGEPGVEHVGRGHAVVHPARRRPHPLGDVGEEGDHVVVGRPLELLGPLDGEAGARLDVGRGPRAGITPRAAQARQTASSTSSQRASFASSVQIAAIAGARVARDHAATSRPAAMSRRIWRPSKAIRSAAAYARSRASATLAAARADRQHPPAGGHDRCRPAPAPCPRGRPRRRSRRPRPARVISSPARGVPG